MVAAALSLWIAGAGPATLTTEMAARGVPQREIVVAFASSREIESFARRAVAEQRRDQDRAQSLYDAIVGLKRSGAIAADRDNVPKARPPKTAAELLAKALTAPQAGEDATTRQAGCYELTALYIALARAVGLDAMGVERTSQADTGQIGHVLAGVRFVSGGPLTLLDLQNEQRGSTLPTRTLGDLELAAQHYSHLAVAAYLTGDLPRAQQAIDWALLLAPDNPAFVSNRATVAAGRGELDVAVADASYAVELAPHMPVYRYNLGRLYLERGELGSADAQLQAALRLYPRYGLARRDLGWALARRGDAKAAERELAEAIRIGAPDAELYAGLLALSRGDAAAAQRLAREGAKRTDDPRLRALSTLAQGKRDATTQALDQILRQLPRPEK